MREPATSFNFEYDVAAAADEIEACLLDPELLASCVPGFALIAVDDGSITGRIRIKQAPVPSVYTLRTEMARAQGRPAGPAERSVLLAGVAEKQRTGRSFRFRTCVALAHSGPDRTRCGITLELPAGDDTQALLERLLPQFVRRLEDVALALPESPVAADGPPTVQAPTQRAGTARLPRVRTDAWATAAAAGVTAVAMLLGWSQLRRRRCGATFF